MLQLARLLRRLSPSLQKFSLPTWQVKQSGPFSPLAPPPGGHGEAVGAAEGEGEGEGVAVACQANVCAAQQGGRLGGGGGNLQPRHVAAAVFPAS